WFFLARRSHSWPGGAHHVCISPRRQARSKFSDPSVDLSGGVHLLHANELEPLSNVSFRRSSPRPLPVRQSDVRCRCAVSQLSPLLPRLEPTVELLGLAHALPPVVNDFRGFFANVLESMRLP